MRWALATLGIWLLLALAPGLGTAAAQEKAADPAVLQAYANAYNSGDAAAAAASFTDNAVWVRPPATGPCSQQTPCVGRDAILRQLQAGGVANNQCLTILPTAVAGSVVTATVEVRADSMRAVGVERIRNVWLVQVAEDKIAALYVLNDLTDPQTNDWRAVQAGTQAPGEPIPNPATPCGSD